jgi:hypothetical protein
MSKSKLFKTLLIVQTIGLLAYTLFVINKEGIILFSVFMNSIFSLNWTGQFNLDFLCYLMLSGFWIMWRNKFTSKSIFIGAVAMVLGIVMFAPYLLWIINKEHNDLKRVLIGDR